MKRKLLFLIIGVALFAFPKVNYGQPINLGAAANFVIYTTGGSVHDNASAHSSLTGDVGYFTSGDFLGFGNVDGVMHAGVDPATTACEADLLSAVAQLNASIPTLFPGLLIGNGAAFTPGVYSIPGNAVLNLDLILDAQNIPNAEFIIKITGTFSTNAGAKVKLINGAEACHVYWLVDGLVSMATNTTMRGTVIANNSAIMMATGDTIEGRLLSTTGSITIDKIRGYKPVGCGSPVLTGPPRPPLGSLECYTIFAGIGALDGNSSSTSIGDVGNAGGGSVTGWSPADVTGVLHGTGDPSTMLAAIDLQSLYDTLNALIPDIELLYPAEFGLDLILTPHVYVLNGTTTFTDSVFLDAQGNADAIFVIKILGATSNVTSGANSRVVLMNGAKAENVFWVVAGAVTIADNSIFRGTIVVPAGAINLWYSGVVLEGRALTINGAINTAGMAAAMPPGCVLACNPEILTEPADQTVCLGDSVSFSVIASGTGLTYQWRRGNVDLIDGGNISGANSSALVIDPAGYADTASDYNVVVYGTCLPNDTSINASLIFNAGPVITSEPMNQLACLGDSVAFTVAASGMGLTYQWRKGNINLIDGLNISGATSDTLIINPAGYADTASDYNVVVTGLCAPNDTSDNVSLILNIPPVITTEPSDQTICADDSVSFIVTATGTGLTYQWRKGTINLIDGVNISGATNDTLTFNPVYPSDTANNYNVIVTGVCAPSDTSINVTLTVNPIPVAIAGSNSPVCIDSTLYLTAQTVTGGTYLWTGPNGFSSTDQNPVIINASALEAGDYTLVVSANGCTSGPSMVTVVVGVCDIDLSVVKTADNSEPFIGHSVFFTIVATNNGSYDATGVTVTDLLQSGYTYISSVATAGTYDPSTGIWTIGNLGVGISEILTIEALVNPTGSYVNTAIIIGNEPDLNTINDVAVIETFPTDFFIPEGFSPNADGINDLFFIRGIIYYPENSILIFNRWGDKVFEANPYQNNWDGVSSRRTVGGDELPVGTYFYLLDLGDGSKVIKGTIYLNR